MSLCACASPRAFFGEWAFGHCTYSQWVMRLLQVLSSNAMLIVPER